MDPSEIPPQPPREYTEMSENSKYCTIAYTIIFVIAATGNVRIFFKVIQKMKKYTTRLNLLILHLSIADLIVTFFLIPMEIFWRISVQWKGGDLLCRGSQFLRAFGLYLSSMVIICISLDRFFSILFPMQIMNGGRRVRIMLKIAWIAAVICAAPQSIIFSVKTHPVYTTFQQCVTIGFFKTNEQEILYNVFSITCMYFIPLAVIIFTYSSILWKITRKRREQKDVLYTVSNSLRREVDPNPNITSGGKQVLTLRRSDNGISNITRARNRTLKLTIVIVIVFLFCATPYVFMLLWYMFDRESAEKIDPRIQDGFFMMAVANSCLNPFLYGSFTGFTCLPFRRKKPIKLPKNNTVAVALNKLGQPVAVLGQTFNELKIGIENELKMNKEPNLNYRGNLI